MPKFASLMLCFALARGLLAVDIALPTTMPRLDNLSCVFPASGGDVNVDLSLRFDSKGKIVAGGDATVDGSSVVVKGSVKPNGPDTTYKIALKGIAEKVKVQLAGALNAGDTSFKYTGPKGKGLGARQASLGMEDAPRASVSISASHDLKGKITGTASIVSGFGNDSGLPGVLKGKLKGDKLSFSVASGSQKLSFKGLSSGDGFRGRLKFKLPPAKGVVDGFFVGNIFTAPPPPPPPPPVTLSINLTDGAGEEAGTLLVSKEVIACTFQIGEQVYFGRDERGMEEIHPQEEGFWIHLDLFNSAIVNVGGILLSVDSLTPLAGSWIAADHRGSELFSGFWTE
jgi:hypothetical protein